MASNSITAQFVSLLIEEYKGLPSLWEVDSDGYKSKLTKKQDYDILLNRMLAVDPLLTMNDLKKKIANIRSCYRREAKKVSDSIESGATGEMVYVPTLWYFDQLDFLRDQEPRAYTYKTQVTSTLEHNNEEQKTKRLKSLNSDDVHITEFNNEKTFSNEITYRMDHSRNREEKEKDEADTFSETWAILFRKLSHEQQLFGKRCIDEILYQGQLGKLNCDTYRSIEMSSTFSMNDGSSVIQSPDCETTTKEIPVICNKYDITSKGLLSFFS